jgi:hypothetical protein
MALDYYRHDELGIETLTSSGNKKYVPLELKIKEKNSEYYPTGITGYEPFY